jgi:hypothetical protein
MLMERKSTLCVLEGLATHCHASLMPLEMEEGKAMEGFVKATKVTCRQNNSSG